MMILLDGIGGSRREHHSRDVRGQRLHDGIGTLGCAAPPKLSAARGSENLDILIKVGESPAGRSLTEVAIRDFIGELYKVEREIKALREKREEINQTIELDEVLRIRQEKSAPVADAFRQWLDEKSPGVPPQSAIGKAMGYSLSQWDKLIRYIGHPEIPADNNYLENHIRPFAVGRRAWLFADTQRGARASANLYSLVTTAKANGLEPREYLTHLYTELPRVTTVSQLQALLPWNAKANQK